MNAARHDQHEFVTTEQCQDKHNTLAWVIATLLVLFVAVGLSGPAAFIVAKDARSETATLEARVDERQKGMEAILAEMRQDLREIKESLRQRP